MAFAARLFSSDVSRRVAIHCAVILHFSELNLLSVCIS